MIGLVRNLNSGIENKIAGVIIYTSAESKQRNMKENMEPNKDLVIGVETDLVEIMKRIMEKLLEITTLSDNEF